jgi:hypothetical protein
MSPTWQNLPRDARHPDSISKLKKKNTGPRVIIAGAIYWRIMLYKTSCKFGFSIQEFISKAFFSTFEGNLHSIGNAASTTTFIAFCKPFPWLATFSSKRISSSS